MTCITIKLQIINYYSYNQELFSDQSNNCNSPKSYLKQELQPDNNTDATAIMTDVILIKNNNKF